MHGSAQPERSPELAPTDDPAGPTLTATGFGTIETETRDNKSDLNSNFEDRSGNNSGSNSSERRVLDEGELASTLQLLVERAQYITGATGTALALPQGDEMVCRASAGASAPAVGARLQVKSGLTGESISRRQLLRCDNAEADPRVNLEACRSLGIASIVVLPLLRKDGEVRGLFELFSDHPYAFEERDLIALERMAALTLTALDLAEQRQSLPSASPSGTENPGPSTAEVVTVEESQSTVKQSPAYEVKPEPAPDSPEKILATKPDPVKSDFSEKNEIALPAPSTSVQPNAPVAPTSGNSAAVGNIATGAEGTLPPSQSGRMPENLVVEDLPPVLPLRDLDLGNLVLDAESGDVESEKAAVPTSASAPVPVAMLRVQKCASCGFPISEGRTLCLDCEKKNSHDKNTAANRQAESTGGPLSKRSASLTPLGENQSVENESVDKQANSQPGESAAGLASKKSEIEAGEISSINIDLPVADSQSLTTASATADQLVPAFLANSEPFRESWLSRNYVNLLAVIVLILCILVAIVVFR